MITQHDLLAIERAAVGGWPALETEAIDGWLARFASGGSVRANTVAALDFHGPDPGAAIDRVIAFYRQRRAIPRFTITGVGAPPGLDAELDRRGWRRHGDHVTMAKDIEAPGPAPSLAIVESAEPTSSWTGVYLQGQSEARRPIAMQIVASIPKPRAFFTVLRDGVAIASGLSVPDGTLASVQCMATTPDARRTGAASAVLRAIERHALAQGARRLYLQTDRGNLAAIALYQRTGFAIVGHYHTRDLVP